MTRSLVLAALLAAGLFLFGLQADLAWLRLVCKPIPVLALAAMVPADHRYGRRVRLGLRLGACGDGLLELSPDLFAAGLAAFLLGHLAYIAAYLAEDKRLKLWLALPAFAWGAGLLTVVWPNLGPMAVPVAAYAAVISTMIWRAAARMTLPALRGYSAGQALIGALVFTASDSLIALNRFHAPISGARTWIILLYWTGQILIARSAITLAPARVARPSASKPPV